MSTYHVDLVDKPCLQDVFKKVIFLSLDGGDILTKTQASVYLYKVVFSHKICIDPFGFFFHSTRSTVWCTLRA